MESTVKKLPKSQMEIEIRLPASEFRIFVDRTISQLGQNIEIGGFRKGKVPKEILEKKVGQEKILKESTELSVKENYRKVISKNNIEAIGSPEIEILSSPKIGGELSFKVKISVLPEIVLPDYKKIATGCKKKDVLVQDKDIENALSWIQRSRAKLSQISRPAQKRDFVKIEFSSPNIEGNAKQTDAFLLGEGHLIPGFEEKLEEMEAGQEKSFSLRFSEKHFQKNLAGREINFEVKMISVQKMELPEINDQFAQSLGQFEDLAALKRNVSQGLRLEKENQESQRLCQEILNKIIEKVSWELPDVLIAAEKNKMLENFKKDIQDKFQTNFEDYLKKVNQTEEELKESFTLEAEGRIKGFLVLNKIATAENIQTSEEEVKEEVNKVLNKYPDIETAKKELDLEKLKLYIESELRNRKVLEMLESLTR